MSCLRFFVVGCALQHLFWQVTKPGKDTGYEVVIEIDQDEAARSAGKSANRERARPRVRLRIILSVG